MTTNWLTSLQPGDEVIVVCGNRHCSKDGVEESRTVERVERVTEKQIIVGGRKYQRDNGQRNDYWGGRLERVGVQS